MDSFDPFLIHNSESGLQINGVFGVLGQLKEMYPFTCIIIDNDI